MTSCLRFFSIGHSCHPVSHCMHRRYAGRSICRFSQVKYMSSPPQSTVSLLFGPTTERKSQEDWENDYFQKRDYGTSINCRKVHKQRVDYVQNRLTSKPPISNCMHHAVSSRTHKTHLDEPAKDILFSHQKENIHQDYDSNIINTILMKHGPGSALCHEHGYEKQHLSASHYNPVHSYNLPKYATEALCSCERKSSKSGAVLQTSITKARSGSSKGSAGIPNSDEMSQLKQYLVEHLPKLFTKGLDYAIYTQDIVLENNFWEKTYTVRGITSYGVALSKLRLYSHFKFANVTLAVEDARCHNETGAIILHWKLGGLPQHHVLAFWKYTPWSYQETKEKNYIWHEGISTYYVNKDVKIFKHRIDRVRSDEDIVTDANKDKKSDLLAKLAGRVVGSPA